MSTSRETIRIRAVGDIMLGDHPVCFGHGVRSTIEKKGFEFIIKPVLPALGDCDLLFGNLETVLSDKGLKKDGLEGSELRGKREYASYLSQAGFNLLSVANNHAMQHGYDAFADTVSALNENRITPIGLSENQAIKPFIYKHKGIEIVFLSYSLRPEKFCPPEEIPYAWGTPEKLLKTIRLLKKSHLLIVVSVHWGDEYMNHASPDQVKLGRQLVDAGACLIIGHHPHVLQGIETYKNGYIIYSLGNFIFDKWQRNPRETIIFSCDIGETGVLGTSIQPVLINRRYQPYPANSSDAKIINRKLADYSNAVDQTASCKDSAQARSDYRKKAERAYFHFRMSSYLYFVRNLYRYDPAIVLASGLRFLKRRLGLAHK